MKKIQKYLFAVLAFLLAPIQVYVQRNFLLGLTGRDVHIDTPLSNIAIEAFANGDYVATKLFPVVGVQKQSDLYYTITKDQWLRLPTSTLRAPKTTPRRVEFAVSSNGYFAHNYALAGENSFEALANADNPVQLRARTVRMVMDTLLRDLEQRVTNLVTSISNIGSGVVLSGANLWSNYLSSDPIADVTTGHAFIRATTGIVPNTAVMDFDTYQVVRRHPLLLDMYKYTQGGMLQDAELKALFKVSNLHISSGIKNTANEGAAATMANIWGNNFLLAYVDPAAAGMQTKTMGLGFRWSPPEVGAGMQAKVYNDPDPGKKVEVVEVGYYQDEKIVAANLAYAITTTL